MSTTNQQKVKSRPDEESTNVEIIGIDQIKDECITLKRTKNGEVSLTRHGVFKLCQRGFSARDIAGIFGVERHTLSEHFSFELTCAKAGLSATLKTKLLQEALKDKPNPSLLILALKLWSDVTDDGTIRGEEGDVTGAKFNVIAPPQIAVDDNE